MHETISLTRAADAISKHVRKIPFLKFGDGEDQLMLCYRKRGEVIGDEECENEAEAVQSGIFRRFRKTTNGQPGYVWMRISSTDPDEIMDALEERFHAMTYVDIESLPLDAAYQVMQHEDAKAAAARRLR